MYKVTRPEDMNETFARAFNSRTLDWLLALYEDDAQLRIDQTETTYRGKGEIARALAGLLQTPGTMVSRNSFTLRHGELALLRADWAVHDQDAMVFAGSSAELVRLQADGSWMYVMDHATGASLERVG